jgi:hypothetical protein
MENEQDNIKIFEIISTLFAAAFILGMFVKFLFF